MGMKKPRLFYWEEGHDAWIPAPDKVEEIIDAEQCLCEHGEEIEIKFKRFDLTDDEMDALPEC
jgi:hypothetical protein